MIFLCIMKAFISEILFSNYAPVFTNKTGVTITKSYKFFLKVFYLPDSSCLLKLFLCVQRVYEAILLLCVKHVKSNSDISLLRQPGEEKKEKKEKKEKRVKKKREEDEGGEWEEVTKGAPMIKVINICIYGHHFCTVSNITICWVFCGQLLIKSVITGSTQNVCQGHRSEPRSSHKEIERNHLG